MDKLKSLCKKTYSEQAKWFLNAFWKAGPKVGGKKEESKSGRMMCWSGCFLYIFCTLFNVGTVKTCRIWTAKVLQDVSLRNSPPSFLGKEHQSAHGRT